MSFPLPFLFSDGVSLKSGVEIPSSPDEEATLSSAQRTNTSSQASKAKYVSGNVARVVIAVVIVSIVVVVVLVAVAVTIAVVIDVVIVTVGVVTVIIVVVVTGVTAPLLSPEMQILVSRVLLGEVQGAANAAGS